MRLRAPAISVLGLVSGFRTLLMFRRIEMNKYLFVLCFLLIALTFACSTASVRMMPGEKGIHRVVVRDIEKTQC